MYLKIKDNEIEKYPYNIWNLHNDNPQTSFPLAIPDERLADWGVYPVLEVEQPTYTYKQNIIEGIPELIDGQWTQTWIVTNKEQEEIDTLNERLRSEAYRNESDPLFFKWQRGEVEQQVWLDKVAEIKARYA